MNINQNYREAVKTIKEAILRSQYRADGNKLALSDLAMENRKALAQDESPTEKKCRYVTYGEKCTIFVGGVYATGEK